VDNDNSGGSDWAFDGFGNLYDLGQPMEIETYGPPPTLRWVPPVDLPQIFRGKGRSPPSPPPRASLN